MLIAQKKIWFAAAVVVAALTPAAAFADGKNEIRAVAFSEDPNGTTLVRVRGAQTPTFTVYKLERPSRVVIDVPQARLAEALRGHEGATVFMPSTWAVSTIAAQQIDDGGTIVRVIVTMARPGRYDVKTENNEVVVMVMARDPMPKGTNPADLAKAQAESEAAKKAAAQAERARVVAEKASASAQAEAERLRKAAAEQTARAAAAQKAADDATRAGQASAADIERAKKMADAARAEAAKAKQDAQRAQTEADRMRMTAEQTTREAKAEAERARKEADDAKRLAAAAKQDVARSKAEAEAARQQALADMQRSKAEVAAARQEAQQDVARSKAEADRARTETDRVRKEADAAKQAAQRDVARSKAEADAMRVAAEKDIAKTRAEAERAKREAAAELAAANKAKADAEAARREAEQARIDAAKTKDAATRTKLEAEAAARVAQAEAAKVKAEADAAKTEAARTKADAELARSEAEAARRDVQMKRAEAQAAKDEAARAKDNAARTNAEIARARSEAEAAKADAERARTEAKVARAEADAAKAAAAADKRQAEADKKRAEAERVAAMALQKDAKSKLAALDKKAANVQALEDKARAAHAAAKAREEAALAAVQQAETEIAAAEQAAKTAAAARDRSSSQVAADKAKLIAQAKEAEERLAKAKAAADAAEARRVAAENAAATAKKSLESTRTTLATVEGQRTAAERAASEAARKRSEAEAAASEAAQRKSAAETAVAVAAKQRQDAERAAAAASKQRSDAEQQRIAAEEQRKEAEEAARVAQAAKVAADKQRVIAENAAKSAVDAKHSAEASLEVLMAKREAAEKAAFELESRSKAEAKAQAALALAQQRKATDEEMAKAKKEADRLAKEREKAEEDLADRRKAVAMQQAEAERLKSSAMQARDAAEREEKRRAQLAQQRAVEEQELARIKAQKADAAKVAATPAPAPAPKVVAASKHVAPKAAFIKNVTFKGSEGSGRVDIALTGEGTIAVGAVTPSAVELIIDNAELAQKLERKLDVSRYGSPVRAVSSFRDRRTPNRVRLIAELSSPATPTLERDSTGVKWSFVSTQTAQTKPMRTQNVPSPVVGGFGAASTPITQQSVTQVAPQATRGRKVYRGAIVDFDYKDAPMADLLRTIADIGKVNIVVPDGIDARVTVRLKKVPWDQALEVILASHGLWYRRDGNLFRIAPRKELDAEDELEAARREAMIKSETPRTDVIPLNYASSSELKPKLEAMLSPKGRIEVDERTNALIVNDVAGNREQIARLALQLDRQTPQISIEARIVEARSTFLRQFGIQWGGRAVASAAGGNATGLVWPSSIGVIGGAEDNQTNRTGVATPSDFAINLPAPVGTGEGGALGLSLGSVGGNFNINLRLSALEDSGTVRIISAPKITVLNNKEAKISQGVSIPISVVSAAGTQTQFVQADLALTVKPYVSQRDCAIAMDLTVTKNEPDFVNTGARGDPSILRKEAKTSMLVADGETSVLGGIYTRNSGLSYKKFPFLADIPVIGWLFKSRRENDDRTEILVFITPKITNKGLLGCQ